MSGLSQRVAEAMDDKRYDDAAGGLTQMNRLTCIDNIVVDRLLEGARNEVKAAMTPMRARALSPPLVLS